MAYRQHTPPRQTSALNSKRKNLVVHNQITPQVLATKTPNYSETNQSSMLLLIQANIQNINDRNLENAKPFDIATMTTVGLGDTMLTYVPYAPKELAHRQLVKWGQLKLMLAELDFFTLYYHPAEHRDAIVVYVGAAPGTHLVALAQLYPALQFKLYDGLKDGKSKFEPSLRDLPNVECIDHYFLDSDLQRYREWFLPGMGRALFLLSDIRNLAYVAGPNQTTQEQEQANERMTLEDMQLQRHWVETLRPTKALLKFRPPYYYDVHRTATNKFEYLSGLCYLQPYLGSTSSETRLVPADPDANGRYPTTMYDTIVYQDVLFAHNRLVRIGTYLHPMTGGPCKIGLDLGLNSDWDSTMFVLIVCRYLIKHGLETSDANVRMLIVYIIEYSSRLQKDLVGLRAGHKPFVSEAGLAQRRKLFGY